MELTLMSTSKILQRSPVGAAVLRAIPQTRRHCARGARLTVEAKVDIKGGPRIIRGKCFVTRDVSLFIKAALTFLLLA
jgi:hypothetical protein